jgi:hypothetical protein
LGTNQRGSCLSFSAFDFQRFFGLFGKLHGRFANGFSRFGQGRLGEPALIRRPGIANKLGKAGVARDGPDLMSGAAGFR